VCVLFSPGRAEGSSPEVHRVSGSVSGLSTLGTNDPDASGCRCLTTRSSKAAKSSTSPLHQMRADTRTKYISRMEGVASVSEEKRSEEKKRPSLPGLLPGATPSKRTPPALWHPLSARICCKGLVLAIAALLPRIVRHRHPLVFGPLYLA
jgi:hypothetical protein